MLTIDQAKQKIDIYKLSLPVLLIDKSVITDKFNKLNNIIEDCNLYYAVKTNPHPEILKHLYNLGGGFEISSLNELKVLKELGIPYEKIITGNTLKAPSFIKEAYDYGVNYFAYDSTYELDKIADLAPGSFVSLRVVVDNNSADWPLSRKFGADPIYAIELLQYAKDKGLRPEAITFHVGSQCMNPASWSNALMVIAEIYEKAKAKGLNIKIINLGGGFPSQLTKPIPGIEEIKVHINKALQDYFQNQDIKYIIEPGRAIVGEAGLMVSSVIARANRGVEKWVSLDVGIYQGLFDAIEGVKWSIISDKELNCVNHKDQLDKFKIGGPTCDSIDVLAQELYFPKDISPGDIVYVMNTGAYTSTLVTNFNGFKGPKIIFVE
jgi:ornithine decarboxylase